MSWWRRDPFIWSPWMSPAEIDAVNGLGGPAEVPPAQVRAPCGLHDEGSYGDGWTCLRCQQAEGPPKVPPAQLRGLRRVKPPGCSWHEEGGYGHVWHCRACQQADTEHEPEALLEPGEGVLY